MKYTIEEIVPKKIAYLRRTGPYGAENHKLMQELKKWAMSKSIFSAFHGTAKPDRGTFFMHADAERKYAAKAAHIKRTIRGR